MENYVKFKLMGGKKKMKLDVVPHVFDCQPDRKRSFSDVPRAAAVKRIKQSLVNEALSSSHNQQTNATVTQHFQTDKQTSHVMAIDLMTEETTNILMPSDVAKKDVSVQVRPKVRSKSIQCKMHYGVTVALSPIKLNQEEGHEVGSASSVSKLSEIESVSSSSNSGENCSESGSIFNSASEYVLSDSEREELEEENEKELKSLNLKCTINKLKNRPRLYMGLPKYSYYVFQLLEKYCKINSMYIFLTLKKIRTGDSFLSLADDFGTSEGNACKIFSKSVLVLSKFLRKCLITPDTFMVKLNLPLAFRARYSNVFCIIDCLEIEIEKPSDALKQSLTWSDYKKCNTLKYLISCTPDGIINFISCAFGGRTSDSVILENSGFLDILPPNVAVMADRGFKHVEHLLVIKGCTLVRPPSVSAGTKLTKSEVLETKRIASLRIHVERVIRRIREFSFLAPHACIDNKLLLHTDNVIKIVCGLINLQSGIISGH